MIKLAKLDNKKLKEILRKINTDTNTRELYSSKLSKILNFLNKNTGFKNAAVKPVGSRIKQTDLKESDMEVIFCTSPNKNHVEVRKLLLEKAKEAFGKPAKIKLGNEAVHIDFKNPKCNFDIVYLTQEKFKIKSKKIKKIRKMRPLHKKAIKLVKYTFNEANLDNVYSYEVELACLTLKDDILADCVNNLIKYFKGRIKKKGLTINKIIKYLI